MREYANGRSERTCRLSVNLDIEEHLVGDRIIFLTSSRTDPGDGEQERQKGKHRALEPDGRTIGAEQYV